MLNLERVETWVRRLATLGACAATLMVLLGLGRALQRPKGRIVGRPYERLPRLLYLGVGVVELVAAVRLWRPIPTRLPGSRRVLALLIGSGLYVSGIGLVVWGRLALGDMYNVSTTQGAELYANHRLVTSGPFAIVRHPMYLGAVLGTVGALLLYRTWTMVLILVHVPVFFVRARREEDALAAEFGADWRAYAQKVPPGLPLLGGHIRP